LQAEAGAPTTCSRKHPTARKTMTMFIPHQQLQNMIQGQALQILSNSTDPTARMIALNSLQQTQSRGPADLMQPIQVDNGCDSWGWVDSL
jgi:hypothetical protein